MKKTNKIMLALIGTVLAGSLVGCNNEGVVYQRPSQPPHVAGYDDRYWVWDEEDGEWEYEPPGGSGFHSYYYNGGLYKKSIRSSSLKSTAISKTVSSGKLGGFGSSFRGFGG